MEISNKIDASIVNVSKSKKQTRAESVTFSGKETVSSASAVESMAKAKISIDNAYSKPIPYEDKIKILEEKKVPEKDVELFLSQNDEVFKEMLEYLNYGVGIDALKSIYGGGWGYSESTKKAADLAKFNVPFSFAKDLFSYYKIPPERIEFLKQAKVDFSDDKSTFRIDDYKLRNILQKDDQFAKLDAVYKKGVDANVAVAAVALDNEEYQKLTRLLDEKNQTNNSATAAYFMSRFTDEDTKKLVELSNTYKLDFNNYDFWINVKRQRDLQKSGELLKLGVPSDCLLQRINLSDEQITSALNSAKEQGVSASDSIELEHYNLNDDERKMLTYQLIRDKKLDLRVAYNLSQFGKDTAEKTVGYMSRGIDYNNALRLATLEKDDEYKEKVISLLPIFEYVYDTETFLNMDLSEEDSAKVLDLVKKGANLYFANFCLQSPAAYEKAMSIYESGACKSLSNLYGGWEEEVLKHLDYVGMGVPNDYVSIFSGTATPEEIELLKSGVRYEALEPLKKYEEQGEDVDLIKEYLKKGISFETAKTLNERLYSYSIPQDIVLNNIYPSLDAYKIIALAKLQQERGEDWISGQDKETLIKFASVIKNSEHLGKFVDLGFMNEKALETYNEFLKRGISSKNSNDAVILSQLDFKDSAQIDRAVELMKRKVPFEKLLFSIADDKSFIDAINTSKKDEYYGDHTILNSYLAKFYQEGLKQEDIDVISKKCRYSREKCLGEITEYIHKGHTTEDAIKISEYSCSKRGSIDEDEEKTKEYKQLLSDLVLNGCHFDILRGILYYENKTQNLKDFIKQGIEPQVAEKLALCGFNLNDNEKIAKIYDLKNSTINEDLKKLSGNPTLYPFIDELFDFDNYNEYQYGQLLKSKVSLQDVHTSAKILVKSPLKQAMKRPNLYLSGIPQEHTEKVNGQYPTLPPEVLAEYQQRMLEFFKNNMVEITRALKYLDVDMFNQLMDKRTSVFSEQLDMLNKMDDKHYELVSRITKCRKEDGKLLSSKEKIDLAKIVLYHQLGYLDVSYLEEMVKTGIVNLDDLNKQIFEKLTDAIGLTSEEVELHKDKLNFDKEYMFLLLRTQQSADFMWVKELLDDRTKMNDTLTYLKELLDKPEELAHQGFSREAALALIDLLSRVDSMEEKEVYKEYSEISPFNTVDITAQDVAKIAVLEDFKSYVQDEANSIGQTNAQTKAKFEKLGLNYDKWVNFSETDSVEFNGHNFDIKLWDRNPQKDLFMGNRTSCCTAIIDGGNGKATPIYLSNTAFNVVEMTDENGDIVAMSRIFVANVDEKPSIIVENIEINNSFLKNKSQEELHLLREKMLGFVQGLAYVVSNEDDMPVYFSKNYTHVPHEDYEIIEKNVDFVGDISSESVYLNCKPGWTEPEKLKDEPCTLYQIS